MSTAPKKHPGRFLAFSKGRGLEVRDYFLAAIANPKQFSHFVRRYLNRRSRMVEAVVRASENPILHTPMPKAPQSFDALLTRLSNSVGVLELSRAENNMRVGVGDVDLLSATIFLANGTPGAVLIIDGKTAHLGMERIKARIQTARSIVVKFNGPDLDPMQITLESYHETEPGKWVSPESGNRLMRAVYGPLLGQPGLHRASDILGAPSLRALAYANPVDAVYTWVNHEDPDWQVLYTTWSRAESGEESIGKSDDSEAISRFHNNDELRYSLRSLDRNLPWLRRIFVFSNCAAPIWLATNHPRLTWVRHEEVIPVEFLPTFSSHVIESFVHRIPGLANQFIYLNDDFFIMRQMSKLDFFTENGLSQARLEEYGVVSGRVREGDPDYLNAARNSAALVREALGFAPTQLHRHVPYALLRPVLEEIENRFRSRIDAFRVNRFRRPTDINIPSFLYHHYAMGSSRAMSSPKDSIMVKSNDLLWAKRLKQAEDKKYYFVCINEGGADNAPAKWHAETRAFLQKRFPKPAEWEVTP